LAHRGPAHPVRAAPAARAVGGPGVEPSAARSLAELAAAVSGQDVRDLRPLRGGLVNRTYLARLAVADGGPPAVVIRVLQDRRDASREAAALRLLARTDVPAPRLLWHGRLAGEGWTVVCTRVPGRLTARPDDLAWLDALADVLAAIHRVEPRGRSLRADPGGARQWLDDGPAGLGELGEALWPALLRRRNELGRGRHVLVHGDFHPGNVHWLRGRIAGVIDWETARWGPPASDVAYLYMDLALAACQQAAERFLERYASRGIPLDGFEAWLLVALARPLPDPAIWLPSWEAAGYRGLSAALLRRRLAALIRQAAA